MSDYTMKNLFDSKKYEDGINFASVENRREFFNEWDYLYYFKCFYKMQNYKDCLEVYREFIKRFPNSKLLDDSVGWCIYYDKIKTFDFERGDRNQFLKQIDYIVEHSSESEYSPKGWIISYVTDLIFKKKLADNPDFERGNKYLSMVDPLKLSLTEQERNVNGRTIKTASEREKWYTRKTKALVELGQFEECLRYIEEAFQNVDRFHNNGNHWMNYKKARCYYSLGQPDAAEALVTQTLNSFSHWCFYELLFNIAAQKENSDDAIRYGCICATSDFEHSLRVSFYMDYAAFLLSQGKTYEAELHFRLVDKIREEKAWRTIHLPEGFAYSDEVAAMDGKEILRELGKFWNTEKHRGTEFFEGVIAKVLPNGRSGFIRDAAGNSYYFNAQDFERKVRDIQEGARVRYALIEKLDKKKNEMKPNAVEISFLK